ncbi:MAG: glutaredoxin family protein [Polyangiaceae bacterium]
MTRFSFSRFRSVRAVAIALAFVTTAPVLAGCPAKKDAPESTNVPSDLVVKDDTDGLLFTWVDEKGDPHVVQKATEVPLVGRDSVRVVDPNREEGSRGDTIFVVDLRVAKGDGTYALRKATRAEFEKFILERRQKHAPTLADPGSDAGGRPAPVGNGPLDEPGSQRPAIIIYGASWCGACHEAAAYLKRKGIPFVEKDIELDADAGREMRAKLSKAGLRSGSIPVIDVRGTVMVGFSAERIEAAMGRAL